MSIRRLISKEYERLRRPIKVGFYGLGRTNRAILERIPTDLPLILSLRSDAPVDYDKAAFSHCYFGVDACKDIDEDLLFLSPSVRRERLEKGSALLLSDLELFFLEKRENCFGVTGSDGKSTTTTLASLLLSPHFGSATAIGNIGKPFIEGDGFDAYAVELSSFSLHYFAPPLRRAVITGITPNHLDWHKDFDEYRTAKLRILEKAQEAILPYDDEVCRQLIEAKKPFAITSRKKKYKEIKSLAYHVITEEDGYLLTDGEPVLPVKAIRRCEEYNIYNLMSAMALALGYYSSERLSEVAEGFTGLSDRCEVFFSSRGIELINSSIDTTPSRTAATLTSLGKRVRILLGGRGKGLSYEPILEPLRRYACRIAIYGEAREDMYAYLEGRLDCPIMKTERFSDAVDYLLDGLKQGDVLLLSPANTGYGEFANYAERGKYFKDYCKNKLK